MAALIAAATAAAAARREDASNTGDALGLVDVPNAAEESSEVSLSLPSAAKELRVSTRSVDRRRLCFGARPSI